LKTSVVIATYNGENFLEEQLYSIAHQSRTPDEIIIIDDCSKDNTNAIIQAFINKFNNINIKFLKNKKNLGVVKTFQIGINLSSNDIIFLADQDDIWEKNKIKLILEILEEKNNIEAIAHGFILINHKGDNISHKKYPLYQERFISFKKIIKKNIFPGCTMAFRSSLKKYFYDIPDGVYIHDWYIAVLAAINNGLFYYNKPLIKYRLHNNNTIGMNLSYKFKHSKSDRINALIKRAKFCSAINKIVEQDIIEISSQFKKQKLLRILRSNNEFYYKRVSMLKNKNLFVYLYHMFLNFYKYDSFRGLAGDIFSIVRE
jgi:glycosyltransferase involved in cell wall biosynthesis